MTTEFPRIFASLVLSCMLAGTAHGEPPESFSLQHAIEVSGSHVPEYLMEYYFFDVDPRDDVGAMVEELVGLLRAANEDRTYIGIVGPFARVNLQVMATTLVEMEDRELSDLTIIYLGPERQRERMRDLADPTGATVIFNPYPDYER